MKKKVVMKEKCSGTFQNRTFENQDFSKSRSLKMGRFREALDLKRLGFETFQLPKILVSKLPVSKRPRTSFKKIRRKVEKFWAKKN